jgi:hypothetical protein
MHKLAETKLETCQGGLEKSNGNLSWAQVKKALMERGGRNGQIRPLPLDDLKNCEPLK